LEVRRPAPAPALGVLVEYSTDEERIVADVRAQQKTFLSAGSSQRDQHVGYVLPARFFLGVRRTEAIGAREGLEEGSDVIRKFAIGDFSSLEDMSGEHVKVERRGNRKMSCLRKDGVHEARMIEDRVAGFDIAQQVDQRNMIVRRTGEGANDELKIRCRETRTTIRLDHRGLIISFIRARRQESWRENAFIHWAAASCGDIRESRISFQP